MEKSPFYLITGFLGSGKTTLIKNILDKYSGLKKIAIVQNEFTPSNIDSLELKNTGKSFEILDVNRGSVFCVCLLDGFIKSLSNFIEEHNPDIIILEATGLADPIALAEMLEAPQLKNKIYLSKVYAVVDCVNFSKLKNNTRVIHQIRIADQIIINKTDLYESSLLTLKSELFQINPYAKVTTAAFCDIDFGDFFLSCDSRPVAFSEALKGEDGAAGRPEVEAKVLRMAGNISQEKIEKFLKTLGEDVYRLKGYLPVTNQTAAAIQYVFGDFKIKEVDHYYGPSELVAMGRDGAVTKAFKNLREMANG